MFDSPEYRRSRRAYIMECGFEYAIALLVKGSILSRLLTHLGFSDAQTGMISSVISFAFLFQLLAVPVIRKVHRTKQFARTIHACGQICFGLLFFIPFLPVAGETRRFLAIALILLAYLGNYFVSTIIYRWGQSFVDPKTLGKFCATKEMFSLFLGLFLNLGFGIVIDRLVGLGHVMGSFLFCGVSAFLFVALDFTTMSVMKQEEFADAGLDKTPFREVLKNTLGTSAFRKVVVFSSLFRIGQYCVLGFIGTYQTDDLGLNMTVIQLIATGATLFRFLVSRPFGRLTDKTSFLTGCITGMGFHLVGFLFLAFASPSLRWLIIPYALITEGGSAGVESNLMNLSYTYVDSRFFSEASGLKNAIAGLAGFLASVGCGKLLDVIQKNGNQLFGFAIRGQQILGIVGAAVMLLGLLYGIFFIRKLPPVDQQKTTRKS